MRTRWSVAQAWVWHDAHPWIMGVNYVPAITLNGIELWQDDTHEAVMRSVRDELRLMEDIGFNSVRMLLPFHQWYCEREKLLDRVDGFVDELARHGITLMPVIFSDCVNFGRPADITPRLTRGWRRYDIGHHGGSKVNPFSGEKEREGWIYWDEPEWRPVMEEYLSALLTRFGKDERILIWDLWNEPGNSNRHERSIPYLRRAFALARELEPIQPLTAGAWLYPRNFGTDPASDVEPIQRVAIDESDVITYHHYGRFAEVQRVTRRLQQEGRPLMNTEWLNRVLDNLVEDNLPYYHDEGIGSYSWGLVAGKSQHFLPWDELWQNRSLPLNRWQHDLFDTYHTPYDPQELELMRRLSPRKDF